MNEATCPICPGKLVFKRCWSSTNEIRNCSNCEYKLLRLNHDYVPNDESETEPNIFKDCPNTDVLVWQYVGWTGAILNSSQNDQSKVNELKDALKHFNRRWGEILNET